VGTAPRRLRPDRLPHQRRRTGRAPDRWHRPARPAAAGRVARTEHSGQPPPTSRPRYPRALTTAGRCAVPPVRRGARHHDRPMIILCGSAHRSRPPRHRLLRFGRLQRAHAGGLRQHHV